MNEPTPPGVARALGVILAALTRAAEVLDDATAATTVARDAAHAAADDVHAKREHRNRLIRRARAEGASLDTIARAAGITRQRVHGIVGEDDPETEE